MKHKNEWIEAIRTADNPEKSSELLQSTKASSAKNLKPDSESSSSDSDDDDGGDSMATCPDSESSSSDSDDDDGADSMATCPVISYSQFEDRVKEIDPLASSNIIRIAGNYLQDMGEVRYFHK